MLSLGILFLSNKYKHCNVSKMENKCFFDCTNTPLPEKKVVLNVTHNKTQLISLIVQYLVDHLVDNTNEVVVTSENSVPIMIREGKVLPRNDLQNTHEEADVMIINQLVYLAQRNSQTSVWFVMILMSSYC